MSSLQKATLIREKTKIGLDKASKKINHNFKIFILKNKIS